MKRWYQQSSLWGGGLMIAFLLLMIFLRPWFAQNSAYLYMSLNLLLALIPLVAALGFYYRWLGRKFSWIFFVIWILWLPNAPYLITDLIHLDDVGPDRLLWYDSLMLFGLAFVGLWSWVTSTSWVRLRVYIPGFGFWVSLLSALGVYIGRYLRFHSWDVVLEPLNVVTRIGEVLTSVDELGNAVHYIITYCIFFFILYHWYGTRS